MPIVEDLLDLILVLMEDLLVVVVGRCGVVHGGGWFRHDGYETWLGRLVVSFAVCAKRLFGVVVNTLSAHEPDTTSYASSGRPCALLQPQGVTTLSIIQCAITGISHGQDNQSSWT